MFRYTASALVDQALHQLSAEEIDQLDLNKFEEKELARLGMPQVWEGGVKDSQHTRERGHGWLYCYHGGQRRCASPSLGTLPYHRGGVLCLAE